MEEKVVYIGPFKVTGAVTQEFKTPNGEEILKIYFEGENVFPEIMPRKTFERLVKELPTDLTSLQIARYQPLLEDLAKVVLEHDIKYSDLAYVAKNLVRKFEDAYERAANLLWTGDDKQWVSGVDWRSDRTLLEVEKILKSYNGNKPTEKTE